ncbi:hypothetical protein [Streptomyces wuyuanensis]|uniref:hypothetical protein n=1 Tax=Streptomyces wuyuanensis TaxID=1196353 RepID=UPI003422E24E
MATTTGVDEHCPAADRVVSTHPVHGARLGRITVGRIELSRIGLDRIGLARIAVVGPGERTKATVMKLLRGADDASGALRAATRTRAP